MPPVEVTTDIQAPVSFVFDALTDPRRGPDWNNNIIDVRGIRPHPVQEGTSWRQTIMMMGKPVKIECNVVRFNPPHEGIVEVAGDLRGRMWTICEAHQEFTRVTQGMDYAPPGGVLGRAGGSFVSGALQGELQRTINRQKQILEREYEQRGAWSV